VSMAASAPVLRIRDLNAFYGESHVLHGVDLEVAEGEVVTLLGRNGSGRTSTLRSILGLVGRRTGSIEIRGRETVGMAPHRIARLGVGYCPEERGIFASLTAEENLLLLPKVGDAGMSVREIYAMFPNLEERRRSPGTRLSGGEQQMLAMARILRAGGRLLLLDEITEGLAPVIVQALGRVVLQLRERGYTIVLVEQNFRFAAPLADRHFLVEHGRIVDMIPRDTLPSRTEQLHRFLGV
jgi:branched-chain amino acid transport system ATP-binding protein